MNKELFERLIKCTIECNEYINKLFELNIDLFNTPIYTYGSIMLHEVLYTHFNEEGIEWIYWYLYEKDGNPELKAFDKYDIEIPSETIDDLWNIVKDYLK